MRREKPYTNALPFLRCEVLTEDDRRDLSNDFWCDVHRLASRFHVSSVQCGSMDTNHISAPWFYSLYGVGIVRKSIDLTHETEWSNSSQLLVFQYFKTFQDSWATRLFVIILFFTRIRFLILFLPGWDHSVWISLL